MFVQVIQGKVSDAAAMKAAMDRWQQEIRPSAIGYLGSTAGVTDDGRFIALARFESPDAARRNGERPEQDKWWAETSSLFDGEVTFRDSSDVDVDLIGNPDDATFVQVFQVRGSDSARAREIMAQDQDAWAQFRPDILATVGVAHDDGTCTVAAYFTSEEEARAGERKEMPPELKAHMDELMSGATSEPEYFDLRDPWLR